MTQIYVAGIAMTVFGVIPTAACTISPARR